MKYESEHQHEERDDHHQLRGLHWFRSLVTTELDAGGGSKAEQFVHLQRQLRPVECETRVHYQHLTRHSGHQQSVKCSSNLTTSNCEGESC